MPDWLADLVGPAGYPGLALVAGAVLLGGFLRGFVGFGSALVTVPVLSLAYGPLVGLPIAALLGLPATLQLLPSAIRFAERPFVWPIALACFAAAPLGTWILVSLRQEVMKIAISAIVLAMVAMLYSGWRLARRPGMATLLGAGALAGLVQGTAGVGGPAVVVVALSRPGTAERTRANVIGAMTALPLSAMPPLWYHGLFTAEVVAVGVALVPLQIGATWLGARVFSDHGRRHYRNLALLALALIGLLTLVFAIRDILQG